MPVTTTSNTHVQPFRLKSFLAGAFALMVMLALVGVPIAYGLRKIGLTHFGGIIESVTFSRASYDPANPLPLDVAVELQRGLERYSEVHIRAKMFVEVSGRERLIGEFREIPVGHQFSNQVRTASGASVTMEADSFDESLIPAMRRAGKVRVVVDELEGEECADDDVANLTVPISFALYDTAASATVFKSGTKGN